MISDYYKKWADVYKNGNDLPVVREFEAESLFVTGYQRQYLLKWRENAKLWKKIAKLVAK